MTKELYNEAYNLQVEIDDWERVISECQSIVDENKKYKTKEGEHPLVRISVGKETLYMELSYFEEHILGYAKNMLNVLNKEFEEL